MLFLPLALACTIAFARGREAVEITRLWHLYVSGSSARAAFLPVLFTPYLVLDMAIGLTSFGLRKTVRPALPIHCLCFVVLLFSHFGCAMHVRSQTTAAATLHPKQARPVGRPCSSLPPEVCVFIVVETYVVSRSRIACRRFGRLQSLSKTWIRRLGRLLMQNVSGA